MSIFGKIKDAFTSDTGTFLMQGTEGLDRKRSQAQAAMERARMEQVRNRLLSDYEAAMAPQYEPAQSIDPSLAGSPDQLPEAPPIDRNQMMKEAFMRAQLQGYDLGGADKTLQMMQPEYEVLNGGDGSYGIVDKNKGIVTPGQLPQLTQQLEEELLRAKIEYERSRAGKADKDALLSAAKAKVGGFAPKQPRAGRQTLPPLPSGKMPIIVSQ